MRKERKHFTPEEKVAILRRHLLDKVPVSELCEELGLRPTVFYRWQKELFENGAAAFQSQERPRREVEEKQKSKPSRKGTGFEQLLQPHQHWHIDVSYINLCGTFYYLCSILDGFSRFLVHWDLRESMREADVELILERAKE